MGQRIRSSFLHAAAADIASAEANLEAAAQRDAAISGQGVQTAANIESVAAASRIILAFIKGRIQNTWQSNYFVIFVVVQMANAAHNAS
jgi:hypothetical protein